MCVYFSSVSKSKVNVNRTKVLENRRKNLGKIHTKNNKQINYERISFKFVPIQKNKNGSRTEKKKSQKQEDRHKGNKINNWKETNRDLNEQW